MRILLLTYLFPPNPAVGALRWEQLSILAAGRGWDTVVVALDPADTPNADMSRLDALPDRVHVRGVASRESAVDRFTRAARSIVRRARGQAAGAPAGDWRSGQIVPPTAGGGGRADGEAGGVGDGIRGHVKRAYNSLVQTEYVRPWARAAATEALAAAAEQPVDVVVSCGPPHMVHRAGRRVARRLGVPHVVDMRDPWSLVERLPDEFASPAWYWMSERYERPVVRDAALVVSNTPAATEALQRRYPAHAGRMITVMNGTDDSGVVAAHGSAFVIAFAGTIYLDRDPSLFFRAVGKLVRDRAIPPDQLRLRFIGNVATYGGMRLRDVAAAEGVEAHLDIEPFQPRAQVMRLLSEAQMLLSLPQDSLMAIPAKVFEYTTFPSWLLVLASRGSATEMLLRDSAAFVVDPADVEGMRSAVERAYDAFRRGERPEPVGADGRFSRERQAEILFSRIEGLVAGRDSRESGRGS